MLLYNILFLLYLIVEFSSFTKPGNRNSASPVLLCVCLSQESDQRNACGNQQQHHGESDVHQQDDGRAGESERGYHRHAG